MRELYDEDGAPERRGPGPRPSWASPTVYGELLSIAEAWSRHERSPEALEPEALVHETWLRLRGQGLPPLESPSHLIALATREMRRVRLDHARTRRAEKRGGARRRVELPELPVEPEPAERDGFEALLARLAGRSPRWARIAELRWERGWTVARVARELGLSPATVEKDSRSLRAWLARELARLR